MILNIGGLRWELRFVAPSAAALRRPNGSYTLGMCDVDNQTIYINNEIKGDLKRKVIMHELAHAFVDTFDFQMEIRCEEMLADVLSKHADDIVDLTDLIIGGSGGL